MWDLREEDGEDGGAQNRPWCYIKKGDDHNWGYCGIRPCAKCDKGKKQSGAELGQAQLKLELGLLHCIDNCYQLLRITSHYYPVR